MRRFIITAFFILFCCTLCINASCQSFAQDGDTFKSVKTTIKSSDVMTNYFYEVSVDSEVTKLPIFITKNNACYVRRTSKKTGKEYRQYLNKSLSLHVASLMGRTTEQGLEKQ